MTSDPAIVPRAGDRRVAAAFVSPLVVLVAVFVVWPLGSTIVQVFHRVDRFGRVGRAVGLDNVRRVLGSASFRSSLRSTVELVVLTVPPAVIFGLALALAAYRPIRGIAVFRVIFASTIATSAALSSAIFVNLLSPSTGVVRYVLQSIGAIGPDQHFAVLGDHTFAIVAVAAVDVWSNLGFAFILCSAALHAVPDELYDSAAVDGAGWWATFRHITLPLIRPMLGIVAIVTTGSAILGFGEIDFLTKGGPAGTTNVLAYSLYNKAFHDGDPSTAAVLSVVLIVLAAIAGVVQVRSLRSRVEY